MKAEGGRRRAEERGERVGSETRNIIRSYKDLEVYKLAYDGAMMIFDVSKQFPKEETYSLIDQIRRSSRSVAANIAEGWGKRRYVNQFRRHLSDAMGSCAETKLWLDFALDCGYLTKEVHRELSQCYDHIGGKLFNLTKHWRTWEDRPVDER